MDLNSYMVCVKCYTFNQKNYIEDALKGFASQQTTFPFVVVVVDDASTDGEKDLITSFFNNNFDLTDDKLAYKKETEYAQVLFAKHKVNTNCYFAVLLLKKNLFTQGVLKAQQYKELEEKSKYVGLCEGDDYWTDPLKLQKQVDYMESHPQHSMCFHATIFDKMDGRTEIKRFCEKDDDECDVEKYILGSFGDIRLNTVLYRRDMYQDYRSWAIGSPIGDGPICLTLFGNGKVAYLNEVMSITRVNSVGSWHRTHLSNLRKRHAHYKKIVHLWKQYDHYSCKNHHKAVLTKMRRIRKNHYKHLIISLFKSVFMRNS